MVWDGVGLLAVGLEGLAAMGAAVSDGGKGGVAAAYCSWRAEQ